MKRRLSFCCLLFTGIYCPPFLAQAAPTDTTYHYEPVPGKTLVIFPDAWTVQRMTWLRTQWGFSGVFIGADLVQYANALEAGYSPSKVVVGTDYASYTYAVSNVTAATYYIDEPEEHDCYGHPTAGHLYSPQELATISSYVHTNRPGSLFIIGGYKRCSHNRIAATYADFIMYSSYKNWDELGLPVCHVNIGWGDDWETPWLPGSDDQRNSWTSMRQVFGTKYSMTWMHGGGDEYANLFAHANALGLTGIWQYNGAPIDSARMESFCYAAWQNGWLARVPNAPLPIQLGSFTGMFISNDRVRLRWMTLSELNNYGFEVQRRASQEIPFETLPSSFIPGHGTTVEPHEYEFVDSNAQGSSWFYRLKQIDLDGSIHFSEAIEVHILTYVPDQRLPTELSLLQNYPNPFNPSTTIEFELASSGFVKLTVSGLLGQKVATLADSYLTAGKHRVVFDAARLASGVYTCILTSPTGEIRRKMLLLK